jgi:anti-anti-sigma factor
MRSGSAVSARGLSPVGLGAKPLGGLALMLRSGLSCAWRSGPAVAGPLIVGMERDGTDQAASSRPGRTTRPTNPVQDPSTAITTVRAHDEGPRALRVEVAGRAGRARAAVRGELNLASAPALERVLIEQAGIAGPVVLDLRELAFIDASGLRLLLRTAARARHDGIEFDLVPGHAFGDCWNYAASQQFGLPRFAARLTATTGTGAGRHTRCAPLRVLETVRASLISALWLKAKRRATFCDERRPRPHRGKPGPGFGTAA